MTYSPRRSLMFGCSLTGASPVPFREHALAQGAQRRRRPALDCPEGCVRPAGDLALREAVEVREDQHLALDLGEPRECGGHVEVPRELAGDILLPHLGVRRAIYGPDPSAAAPDQVRRPVAGDAIHPGGEARSRGVEARSAPPYGCEDILNEVLRQ